MLEKSKTMQIHFTNGESEVFKHCKEIELGKKLIKFKSCMKDFRNAADNYEHEWFDVTLYRDKVLYLVMIDAD